MYFKNYFLISCFIIGLFFCSSNVNAVPARPTPVTITQGNGEKLTIIVRGNESFNYRTTLDGYLIQKNNEGNYCYLTLDVQGNVILSSVIVHDIEKRNTEEILFLNSLDKETILNALQVNTEKRKKALRKSASAQEIDHKRSDFPTIGDIKTLVILVEFPNIEFTIENPIEEFSRLLNESGYNDYFATGSAWDYFYDNSGGKFNPQFDVYGPVMLSQHSSYYHDQVIAYNRQSMVEEACRILSESKQVDFSDYDMDNDGIVDNVFLFCAGYSAAAGADEEIYVWPHKFDVWDLELELNGKRLNDYACSNELRGVEGDTIAAIGTFAHEFCHVLGLPDLYVTDRNVTAFTPHTFSVLDKGCYNNEQLTPCNLTAYERFCIGWLEPIELNSEPLNVGIRNIESNEGYLIKTSSKDEFFILENRQLEGWDKYIPGHGMLVWHIDYDEELWIKNQVNNVRDHQRVRIVEADGETSTGSIPGDPFPGTANVTEFTDTSKTPMKTWTGEKLNKGLTEIKEEDGIIFFRFKGGVQEKLTGKIESLQIDELGEVSFTASWTAYEGSIFGYVMDLYYWDGTKWEVFENYLGEDIGINPFYTVKNLDPATEYKFRIAATDGFSMTEYSDEVMVKTQEAITFENITPEVKTYDIKDEAFVISWKPVDGAISYLVNAYQKEYTAPEGVDLLDFTDLKVTLNNLGWETDGTVSTSPSFTPEGYYGEATPSLRLDQDNKYLLSPNYDKAITYLSFWGRGRNASSEDAVSIKGYNGRRWVEFARIEGLDVNKGEGKIFEFTFDELKNYNIISVTFEKSTGSSGMFFLDDLTLEYGTTLLHKEVKTEEVSASIGGDRFQLEIENLEKNQYYYYTVTGLSANSQTRTSKEIEVFTNKELSSIDEIEDSSAIIVGLEAIYIKVNNDLACTLDIYDIMGKKVYTESFSNETVIENNKFSRGVYLIKIDQKVHKVIIP